MHDLTHTHAHTHTHTLTHTHTHTQTYIHNIYTHAYVNTCICIHQNNQAYNTDTHIGREGERETRSRTDTCKHIHVYIVTYIDTNMHHTQIDAPLSHSFTHSLALIHTKSRTTISLTHWLLFIDGGGL